jgi:chromosome partitioning protein
MKIIAVANQKGGVGKTTITRELSACCALRGYQVLSIDSDPQGNLTTSWINQGTYEFTLAHVLIEPPIGPGKERVAPLELDKAIFESPVENLDLIPADIRLARFEQEPDDVIFRLKNQLVAHGQGYDLIFLDCPPQLGKLLTAALMAADYVLIPIKPDVISLDGLGDLAYTIGRVKKNANPQLEVLGAIINLYKPSRRVTGVAMKAIQEAQDTVGSVFATNLHDYAEISEAPLHKLPAVLSAKRRPGAELLEDLTDEVLDKLQMGRQKLTAVI